MKEISYSNVIVQNDLVEIVSEKYEWERLKGKSILITGANGMLATYLVYTLYYLNQTQGLNIQIIALVRNAETARMRFSEMLGKHNFKLLIQDVTEPISYSGKIDYIIHAAGLASAYAIVNDPVGIIKANTLGTLNVLETAKAKCCVKILFTSTREVYGKTEGFSSLTETDFGILDPLDARSCYPESKRLAETLLKAYEQQHGINFNTLRIAHVYGPGMKLESDGRVMADLLSNVINNQDIILKSSGEGIRAFCYLSDAIKAIWLILLAGEKGVAYNIANESETITIKDLASLLVSFQPDKKLQIKFEISNNMNGYTKYERVRLSTEKVESLGWTPTITLREGFIRTIKSFGK